MHPLKKRSGSCAGRFGSRRFFDHRPLRGTEEDDKRLTMDEAEFLVARRGPETKASSSGANWHSDLPNCSKVVFRSGGTLGQESTTRAASADAAVVSRVPFRLDDSRVADFEDIRDDDGFVLHDSPEKHHTRMWDSSGWSVQHWP